MRYRHCIFDLYGTLVDIRTDERSPRLWARMAELYRRNGAACRPEELREGIVKPLLGQRLDFGRGVLNGFIVRYLFRREVVLDNEQLGRHLAEALLEDEACRSAAHVRIVGVMGIATHTDNREQVRGEFRRLQGIFTRLRERYFADEPAFREVSMGMSGDYPIAVEEGATLVRVGSSIFGERTYPQEK